MYYFSVRSELKKNEYFAIEINNNIQHIIRHVYVLYAI